MNPLGLAFAFAAFGIVGGLGLFIAGNATPGLIRSLRESQVREGPFMFMHTSMLVFGIALIVAGGYAAYMVIYG